MINITFDATSNQKYYLDISGNKKANLYKNIIQSLIS